MIRVVPLDSFDLQLLNKFCQNLYTAFGVGTQLLTDGPPPPDLGETVDAVAFLENAPAISSYADDKILFLTPRKLRDRKLSSTTLPTHGLALMGQGKAIITSSVVKDLESGMKLLSRHALHQVGHLWELHHCLDPRCAMYPPWTPSYAQGDSTFCNFCREKSEDKIRLAKS